MKNFIYLDTDYLTSALSQIHNGKVNEITENSVTEISKQVSETEPSDKTDAKLEFGIPSILKASLGTNSADSQLSNTLSYLDSAQKMVTKSFDDNMYDVFVTYLRENEKLNKSQKEIGGFYFSKSDCKLIDLEFVLTLLTDDFISIYVNEKKIEEELSKGIGNLNREDNRQVSGLLKKKVQEEVKMQTKNFTNIRKLLKTINSAMPSPLILATENMILPMKRNFLRGDYQDISFKYQNKISLLAQPTRRLSVETQYQSSDALLHAVDIVLPNILNAFNISVTDDTLVAIPIGVYFE